MNETMILLTAEEIQKLRTRRDQVKSSYSGRNELFERYEEIYYMKHLDTARMAGVDPSDIKRTISPNGRNKVLGLKRILDTSEIQIKVKERGGNEKVDKSDEIEEALKTMLRVSGEYKPARPEKDTNLASILYGYAVLSCSSVDDLLEAKAKEDGGGVNKFIKRQLETIRKRTPFIVETINPKDSYPEFGEYGLVGHLHEYKEKGSVIKERWGINTPSLSDNMDYIVQDFFHYDDRLVEAGGTTLFAGKWITENEDGEIQGITSIPVFVRLSGGTTLFSKPEEQSHPFLYGYAKGEIDKTENLFLTYLRTAIAVKGLTGMTLLRDPDDTSDIKVDYAGNVKVITAKGKLDDYQVINGDVVQLKNILDEQGNQSTIQNQTIGGVGSDVATFSSYVMQMNAGKLPAVDPIEAQEGCYRDLFLHILQRIKTEGIENDLIDPADIPDDIDLEVTLQPNLQQDDLRNTQMVTQTKASGVPISDEWLMTNIMNIQNYNEMIKQKTKEDMRKAIVSSMLQDQEFMQQLKGKLLRIRNQAQAQPQIPQLPQGMPNTDMPSAQSLGNMNVEAMPQTDALSNRLRG